MILNIATFNINKNGGDFPNRIYKLADVIGSYKIDIIAFQEDFTSDKFSSSDILNAKLKLYKYTLKTREKIRDGIKSSSNLTILSKFKAEKIDNIYFNNIKNEQRAALFLTIKIDNQKLLIINTHLCHLDTKNRIYQLKKILEKIYTQNIKNIILCGDLNSTPNSNELKLLKNEKFNYFNKEHTAIRAKTIDYILLKGNITSKKCEVVLKNQYSDHYCIINAITL